MLTRTTVLGLRMSAAHLIRISTSAKLTFIFAAQFALSRNFRAKQIRSYEVKPPRLNR